MCKSKLFPKGTNKLDALFGKKKIIIGVIHALPTLGSPHYKGDSPEEIYHFAVSEAKAYADGGVDGIIVENGWDIPFSKPDDISIETVATMAVMTDRVCQAVDIPVGVNILANGVMQSLATAKVSQASFVRSNQWANAYVANEGLIEGAAAKALRYRTKIKAEEVMIMADVHVKHGSHSIVADRSVPEQTRDVEWFAADVLIATGNRTGHPTPLAEVETIKNATTLPVVVGSGLNIDNVAELLSVADGAIVASSLKKDGVWWKPVELEQVKKLMDKVYKIREKIREFD
ncbi:MAG: BtpA/SgcQ family protein [Halanaerobiales bacterium]|nr:BtpA/SgcQ family protein [Halanaerobiales bacterium]